MVAGAPTFSPIAADIEERIADCVFVAHNARFDHGFLKHAFARVGRPVLRARRCARCACRAACFRTRDGHGLDAVVARHGLTVTDRHRALGDARALWAFVQVLYREVARGDRSTRRSSASCAFRACRRSFPPDALDALPEAPGRLSLLRRQSAAASTSARASTCASASPRISAGDWQRETDLRLSQEIRRIEFEETAGELGALLREAHAGQVAAARAQPRAAPEGGSRRADARPTTDRRATSPPPRSSRRNWPARYGPFASQAQARAKRCARSPRSTRCAGGGSGWRGAPTARALRGSSSAARARASARRSPDDHDARLAAALAPRAIPRVACRRHGARCASASADGERVDVHVLRDWCWLGTARDDGELARSSRRRRGRHSTSTSPSCCSAGTRPERCRWFRCRQHE